MQYEFGGGRFVSCEFVTKLSKLRKLSAESVENTKKFDPFKEYAKETG